MLEEHDHRHIAERQQLFHFQDEAPGMVFWHPRGALVYRLLEEAARREIARSGYREVRTPELLRQSIWEASGHWAHFAEGMFKLEEDDGRGLALRPVNCPGHTQLYRHELRSYRDLPLRLAEFGVVHRKEPSGALQGLFRLRQFTQDDGHIFCRPDQLEEELADFCRSLLRFYRAFGFEDVELGLSTRPEQRIGDAASWDHAEGVLRVVAAGAGIPLREQPGEGAFYGPKLEFKLRDRLGRIWQCGTIQLDFNMPERFDLSYTGADGRKHRPVMLHRALYGSLERFLGVLLEHYAGQLPTWLAPEQARVLPVGPAELAYAQALVRELVARGVRAELAAPSERLGARVAAAHQAAVPFQLIVGAREVATEQVSVRHAQELSPHPLAHAVTWVAEASRLAEPSAEQMRS
jgi:threonyl-tRNA synthetase